MAGLYNPLLRLSEERREGKSLTPSCNVQIISGITTGSGHLTLHTPQASHMLHVARICRLTFAFDQLETFSPLKFPHLAVCRD